MSQDDHEPRALVQCIFARPRCVDKADRPLFSDEYKRTNRTRASKIVRCFPHCCPTHRPRSYCGTSLHVEVSAAADQDLPLSDLVVLGRFEEHIPGFSTREDVMHLELGQRMKASDILDHPSRLSPWVTGKLVDAVGNDASADEESSPKQIYALHGSDDGFNHWEYDWKSGTSQRYRWTQHHFRVYVFATRADSMWEVVGVVTSPQFTFAVYRKHQHDPELLRRQADCVETQQSAECMTGEEGVRREIDDSSDSDEDEPGRTENQGHISSSVLRDLMWHHQHHSTATATTSLAIIALMTLGADPGWVTMHSRSLFAILQGASEGCVSPEIPQHVVLHYVNYCVPQLMAQLPREKSDHEGVDHRDSYRTHHQERRATWRSTAELLSGLVCFMLEPSQVSSMLSFATESGDTPDGRALHVRWVDRVSEQIENFLQGKGQSTESLVDDIVSAVLGEETRQGLQHRIRTLLRNTEVLGQAQFTMFCTKLRASMTLREDLLPDFTGGGPWDGHWVCRGFEGQGDRDNPVRRRQSWPQLLRSQPATALVEPSRHWRSGVLDGLATIVTAFGFSISHRPANRADESHGALRLSPIGTPLAKVRLELPLDHKFRDGMAVLPVEWSALLSLEGRGKYAAFCRARALSPESDEEQLELDVFVVAGVGDELKALRCVLRFELVDNDTSSGFSTRVQGPLRRRLLVHVQVEEAKKHALPAILPETLERSTTTIAHQLFSCVKLWAPIAAFKGTYSAME